MIEFAILDNILNRIQRGGVRVTYWDGQTKTYGPEPYLTVCFHNPAAVRQLARGSLGVGEAYMDGLIDIEPIDRLLRLQADNRELFARFGWMRRLRGHSVNTRSTQPKQVRHHYDLGNDFFAQFLDPSMTYSCGYWDLPEDMQLVKLSAMLGFAQQQKLDHVLRKLQLRRGMRLLDIGCGWGSLAIRATQLYPGLQVLGITLSENQAEEAETRAVMAGVDHAIRFEVIGYQALAERSEQFDRIVSVGMFEHVGRANHPSYFDAVAQMLVPGGLSLLHTISHETEQPINRWIDRYIFPGGYIPSKREMVAALPRYDLHLLDFEDLRLHYAMTLDAWLRRYEDNFERVVEMFDERFARMWRFYLAVSGGSFRYGGSSLSQLVFSKGLNNELALTRRHIYDRAPTVVE